VRRTVRGCRVRLETLANAAAGPADDHLAERGAVKSPAAAGADGEVVVRLPVDPALDAGPARLRPDCHRLPPTSAGLTYG
jgi:hypothetical protein